jgi:hypothetical protein
MTVVTLAHIERLKALEAEVNYDQPPRDGGEPFKVIEFQSPVIISAPHGARTFRNSNSGDWHEEDEYTAGMALLLGELCKVTVIATTHRIDSYDPNYTPDPNVPYKQTLGKLIHKHHVRYVIDLHGAALNSPALEPNQTIDLGLRQRSEDQPPSMNMRHVKKLKEFIDNTGPDCDPLCFVVGLNQFPGARDGTVISYAVSQTVPGTNQKVQAVQIEMKPQVRIAERFPSATLYKSDGPYQAKPENIRHMLQALANFIDYLKETQD